MLTVENTLTGERERFEVEGDEVLLYLCGLTTSDPAHLGHARTWVHTDVIHRWLAHLGYDVRHVENFTDVNEKIVARVGEDDLGDSEEAVARTYVAEFLERMRALNLKRAEVYPRVSEHVPEIIDLIETLIDRGYAYEAEGSVYFDTTEFEDYGQLSNQDLDSMEAGEDARSEKRNPTDFALWKGGGVEPGEIAEHRHPDAAPADEACETALTWQSPWGEGRPGWHIECSAMAMTHLDETIDIHVAGQDLVFPHNENETAQSEAATGERFARYWLHTGLLETRGEKMSSSLGNYLSLDRALEEHDANVVRTFFLSSTYSARQTYSEAALDEAADRWERLSRAYDRASEALDSPDARTKVEDEELREAVTDAREAFTEAMNDDFNAREALAALDELASAVNAHAERTTYDYRGLRRAVEAFDELAGGVFGLVFDGEPSGEATLAGDLVELLLDVRESERADGNYERADEIRDALESLGVAVEDTDEGPTYRL